MTLAFAGNNLQGGFENFGVIQLDRLFGVDDDGFAAALFRLALFAPAGILAGHTEADILFRQVHNVADRGFDGIVRDLDIVDSLRLGGRFDDDERTGHVASCNLFRRVSSTRNFPHVS